MKMNMIALLLSIVMAVGSISGTPVFAAETTAEEAVAVEEETEDVTNEEPEEMTVETEAAETNGADEDASEGESAVEIEKSTCRILLIQLTLLQRWQGKKSPKQLSRKW